MEAKGANYGDTIVFNVKLKKYEASGKTNIHIINNKIKTLDINIKEMNIDQFHDHVYYMTTALAAHSTFIMDLMHHLFKAYTVSEESEFRD